MQVTIAIALSGLRAIDLWTNCLRVIEFGVSSLRGYNRSIP